MADPNWNRGFYYDGIPPHNGMKLARQIATITYRSGPEWEQRFGRRMLSEKENDVPRLSPDFLIETYLDHQVGRRHLGSFCPGAADMYRESGSA
jgi:homoserine O-acetyltransferase